MPETAVAPRTRTVKTTTEETVPVGDNENKGLGMPWDEWTASVPVDELALTTIYGYRKDPPTISGFLFRSGGDGQSAERIDCAWLQRYYGGGTYDLTIRSKSGKSHYERGVKIAGEPKLTPREQAASTPLPISATPAAAGPDAMQRLTELLDKTIDRLTALQQPAPHNRAAEDASIEILRNAANEAVKIAGGSKPTEAPKSALGDLESLLSIVAKLKPEPDPLDRELRSAFIKKLTDPPPAPAASANPVDQLTQLTTLIDLVDKLRGDGGGRGDWKSVVAEKIGDAVPHLVDGVKNIMEGRAKEADATARAQAARAQAAASIERIRGGQPPPITSMPTGPAAPGAPPAPAAAADWGGPLNVVPIAAATPTTPTQEPSAGTPAELQEAIVIDRYFKNRVVALIAEGAHPGMVLDFIDGASPQIGALLSRATERQIRDFLAGDEVLVQATRLPNFEVFLKGLMAELKEPEDEPTGEPPTSSRVQ
jgi:hypothetical protein